MIIGAIAAVFLAIVSAITGVSVHPLFFSFFLSYIYAFPGDRYYH